MPTAWAIAGRDTPTPRMPTACGMLVKPLGTVTPAMVPTRSLSWRIARRSINALSTTPTDTGVRRSRLSRRSALTTTSGSEAGDVAVDAASGTASEAAP